MITLNNVRVALKHFGVRPDSKQWANVHQTYEYISEWCADYLQLAFEELDQSVLIVDTDVRYLFQQAKKSVEQGLYQQAFEHIATALMVAFNKCNALSGFEAGKADAEQALRIASFGVPANDFLSLQHFLPYADSAGKNPPQWKQSQYGHAGNWSSLNAEFCLNTGVNVVVKIQDADSIPDRFARCTLRQGTRSVGGWRRDIPVQDENETW